MLAEITIENLAIIEALRIEFGGGLNVLTGETGTGKSIIIDAVNLLLGSRASSEMVRTGCDKAVVEGLFVLSDDVSQAVEDTLKEYGLWDEGSALIVRREVSAEGRSVSRVNGRAVPLSVLGEISRHLVDIHGQGEHLSLMQVRRHIDFLDRYGGLGSQREAFARLARRLNAVRNELRDLQENARDQARRVDLLTFQSDEIRGAKLQPGEDETLRRERGLLANAEKRMALAAEAYTLLSEGEEEQRSATDLLAMAVESIAGLAKLDDTLEAQNALAEGALYQLEELARAVRQYRDDIEFDPDRLEEVEERMDLIQGLQRKYGDTIKEVLAFADRAEEELHAITHSEERADGLRAEEESMLGEMAEAGRALGEARRGAAARLSARIEEELDHLSMSEARFLVDLAMVEDAGGVPLDGKRYAYDGTGLDRVEFLIGPNPGEDPKPLAKTASGGETSRLMLAMKTALSDVDPVPTLIFDEVDSGIGGRTGDVVGAKLGALA
ncbi:MAG: DNA repair protein RecN, partial [Chloroflexi bacterium]|nr:DNA repair protein RecN [Chloroflexota bacterium]